METAIRADVKRMGAHNRLVLVRFTFLEAPEILLCPLFHTGPQTFVESRRRQFFSSSSNPGLKNSFSVALTVTQEIPESDFSDPTMPGSLAVVPRFSCAAFHIADLKAQPGPTAQTHPRPHVFDTLRPAPATQSHFSKAFRHGLLYKDPVALVFLNLSA